MGHSWDRVPGCAAVEPHLKSMTNGKGGTRVLKLKHVAGTHCVNTVLINQAWIYMYHTCIQARMLHTCRTDAHTGG